MGGKRSLSDRNVQVVSGSQTKRADTVEHRRPSLGLSSVAVLPRLLKVLERFALPCPQVRDQIIVERRFHRAILFYDSMSATGGKRTLRRNANIYILIR